MAAMLMLMSNKKRTNTCLQVVNITVLSPKAYLLACSITISRIQKESKHFKQNIISRSTWNVKIFSRILKNFCSILQSIWLNTKTKHAAKI